MNSGILRPRLDRIATRKSCTRVLYFLIEFRCDVATSCHDLKTLVGSSFPGEALCLGGIIRVDSNLVCKSRFPAVDLGIVSKEESIAKQITYKVSVHGIAGGITRCEHEGIGVGVPCRQIGDRVMKLHEQLG